MKDHLKQYIQEHREAFDTEMPAPDLWKKLEQELPSKNLKIRKMVWNVAKIAALLVLVFGLGMYLGGRLVQEQTIAKQLEEHTEYQEVELYYSRQVNQKIKEIKATKADIAKELAELDTAFQEWKLELGEEATPEEVIDIMIRNYQLKIEILEQLKRQLQEERS